jgi:hypothetical protein
VFPVRYELGVISQKTAFFIAIAVKTSNLTYAFLKQVPTALQTRLSFIFISTSPTNS